MTTKFLGLRTVGYKVPDIQAAKEWYTKVLGFGPYFDEPFYVGFNVGGYELGLQPGKANANNIADSMVVYWGVEDVHQVFEDLMTLGATELEKPSDVGEGIIVAAVKDPWGNPFGIIYNPHFKIG